MGSEDSERDENAPAEPGGDGEGRRRLLTAICLAFGGVSALVLAAPAVGLNLAPLRRKARHVWRDVGTLNDFPVGATKKVKLADPEALPFSGPASHSAAWVRRTGERSVVALGVYCTHVGCPVRWEEGAKLFLCPCHGGAFDREGNVAAGPPPRPLPRHETRVREGRLEIRTAAVQEALGGDREGG